jgi:hypothetical protein
MKSRDGNAPQSKPSEAGFAARRTFRGVALLKEALGETNAAREAWQQALAFYQAAGIPAGIEEARTQRYIDSVRR